MNGINVCEGTWVLKEMVREEDLHFTLLLSTALKPYITSWSEHLEVQ